MSPLEKAAEVLRLDAEATPGEWQWFGNTDTYSCYLATVHGGHVFVLQFERWGMQQAQPRFQWPVGGRGGCGYMRGLKDLPPEVGPQFEVDYRRDFVGINHPDARLIAYYRTACPALAREVQRLAAENERLAQERERLRIGLMHVSRTTDDPDLAQWASRYIDGDASLTDDESARCRAALEAP